MTLEPHEGQSESGLKPWHIVKSGLVGGTTYVCKCQHGAHGTENKVTITDVTQLSETFQALAGKAQFLIDAMDAEGYLPDHCFTFPDGDIFIATGFGPGEG